MTPLRSARLWQSGNVCGSHGNELKFEIVDGKTGSLLTKAGNVRGCEEEIGRLDRILGPGGIDSRVEAVGRKETLDEMV